MRILIVDDDSEDREFLCDAIKEINPAIECIQVGDGDAAMRLLAGEGVAMPDFIFLDINMPRMNGKECLVEIKSNPKLKAIPVVIYTTSSEQREMDYCRKLGAREFIVKPNDYRTLLKCLTSVLQE